MAQSKRRPRRDYKNLSSKIRKRKTSFIGSWQEYLQKILSQSINISQFFKPKPAKNPSRKKVVETTKENIKSTKSRKTTYNHGDLQTTPPLLLRPFVAIFAVINQIFISTRGNLIRLGFIGLFLVIAINFAQLQVFGKDPRLENTKDSSTISNRRNIIPARRGQIYIRDLGQGKDTPITSTNIKATIWIDPKILYSLAKNDPQFLLGAAEKLSQSTNLPFDQTYKMIKEQVNKKNPVKYFPIKKDATEDQRKAIKYLTTGAPNKSYGFGSWVGIDDREIRSYPEGKLMASTIGYTPNYEMTKEEVVKRPGCREMITKNEQRGTEEPQYIVGERGVEEKYCSVLAGINGKRVFNQDLNNGEAENSKVANGGDLYLTIDRQLQRKAEQILQHGVEVNTNANGAPRDGCILVLEAKTGRIMANASWPSYDPNKYWEFASKNPTSFHNACTGIPYEVGSVMKPITVATALNVRESGLKNRDGKSLGISPDFAFYDYDQKGKLYPEINGNTVAITNAKGVTYKGMGRLGIKEIIRDSINTGIADIVYLTRPTQIKEYFLERFRIGRSTLVNLPGDTMGSTSSFEQDLQSGCEYCFAAKGFGQGFSITPIQLVRAYTVIANRGFEVEPYLVEKIKYPDGVVDRIDDQEGILKRPAPQPVISPRSAQAVTSSMVAMLDEGYLGQTPSKGKVPGYVVAAKSGTAQVSRPFRDKNGNPLRDEKGRIRSCNQECNTKRGIYDHTFIGFNTNSDSKYIIMVKLSEPKPGDPDNFSSDTVAPLFSEMMKFTLEYMKIPRDRAN